MERPVGYVGMAGQKRLRLFVVLAIPIGLLALLLATAKYGSDGLGVHYVSRPPFASVSWGPAHRYMVQSGINVVWDHGAGAAGNVVEFPIAPETRISARLFSVRWLRQEFRGWVSGHKTIARWMGLDRCI